MREIETRPLHPDTIHPSPTNPRKIRDDQAFAELVESVRRLGVLEPILVRPTPDHPARFQLVCGERRWRAAVKAELEQISARVVEASDVEVLEIQIVENLQRADVHPLDEAEGFGRLLKQGRLEASGLAERIGRPLRYVHDRLGLLKLGKRGRRLFLDGRIHVGHAQELARLEPEAQERAIEGGLFEPEGLLWEPYEDGQEERDPLDGHKPRTVGELRAWIDEHVRFRPSKIDPVLFPETVELLHLEGLDPRACVPITHEHALRPEARDAGRTYTCRSWKRADGLHGSKPCEHAVVGLVVAGPERGSAFKVCTARKDCRTHWGQEIRARAKAAAEAASGKPSAAEARLAAQRRREEEEQAKAQRTRDAFQAATPAILEALAEACRTMAVNPSGPFDQILLEATRDYHREPPKKAPVLERGSSAEELVRLLAFRVLVGLAHPWRSEGLRKPAKAFGVDIRAIMAPHLRALEAKAKAPEAKVKASRPGKAKAKAKARRRAAAASIPEDVARQV